MLERFIEWLEDFVIDTGVYGIVKGVVGNLAFGGILSVLLDNVAIKAAVLVSTLLAILGIFIILTARLAALKRSSELTSKISGGLADLLMGDQYWRITNWKQRIEVEKNGDTASDITIDALSEIAGLSFFRMLFGSGWDQPERHRRRVKVTVETLASETSGAIDGHLTKLWRDDNRLEVLIHFAHPLKLGEPFSIRLRTDWPGKCQPMMRARSADEFVTRPSRGLGSIDYTVVLPRRFTATYAPIGFTPMSNGVSLTGQMSSSGRFEVTLSGSEVPPTRRLGFRLTPTT